MLMLAALPLTLLMRTSSESSPRCFHASTTQEDEVGVGGMLPFRPSSANTW